MKNSQLFSNRLRKILMVLALCLLGVTNAWATCTDSLIESAKFPDGTVIPYMLTSSNQKPSYALIVMPGGAG
jgi:hypothetical protein